MNDIILTPTTKQELVSEITSSILTGMSAILKESKDQDLHAKEWLTAKETETLLKVSPVTRWSWTNTGILKGHKIGKRLRYRKDEVLKALLRIEAKK